METRVTTGKCDVLFNFIVKKNNMYHDYSPEEKTNIINWIRHSIIQLIERDSDLLSPERIHTNFGIEGQNELNREVHETSINHRLARYVEDSQGQFRIVDYSTDIEYNRFINQRKMVRSIETGRHVEVRPDILVHKRTRLDEPLPHLLVVEAKKKSLNDKDRNHVYDIMMDENYRYKFGLLISYYESETNINCNLITLENGEFNSHFFAIEK